MGADNGIVVRRGKVSKTFKTCAIFCFTSVWLVAVRILMGELHISDNANDWLFTGLVQIVGMGVVPILLYKFWVKENVVSGFSLRVKINPLLWIVAIVIGVVLRFFIRSVSILWQTVAFLLGYTPVNGVGTIYSGPEVLVMSFLVTAILPAICEELTYRGLGMQMFSGVKNEKIVIVLLGLLFGLGHQFVLQTGYAFIAGMVFAFIAVKTRSILPCMIVHFINNALSVISDFSEQKENAFYAFENKINEFFYRSIGTVIITLIVSAVVLVALLILVKKLSGKKEEESTEGSTYYYPKTTQYVDELFGKGFGEIKVVSNDRGAAWYEYAFLYAALTIMTLTTVFSFVWGLLR